MSRELASQPTPYTLMWVPDSANLIVRMVLEELGAAYSSMKVDGPDAAHRNQAFLALNPQGLVPVLVDPQQDEPLFETAAIVLHLTQRHGTLQPADARAHGRYLKWLFFLSNTLHADLRGLFYSARYVADAVAIPALREALRKRVAGHFALLDAEMARHGSPWLLGEAVSACDIYLAVCARWAQLYPRGDALAAGAILNLPRVRIVLEALEGRPAIQRACAMEGIHGRFFTAPAVPVPAAA